MSVAERSSFVAGDARPDDRADPLRTWLARRAAGAFVANAAGIGIGFVAQLVLARVLGATDYGVYAYVFAWLSVLTLAATAGFQTALVPLVARSRARAAWRLRAVVWHAEHCALGVGLVLVAVAALAAVALLAAGHGTLAATLGAGLAAVPLAALLRVRAAALRGFGRPALALAVDVPVRELTVLALVGVIGGVFAVEVGPPAAMTALLLGHALGLTLATRATGTQGYWPGPPAAVRDPHRRVWSRLARRFLFVNLAGLALRRTDVLLVGWLLGTTPAGAYAVAVYAADLAALPLVAVNGIFGPTIAALHARGQRDRLARLCTTTARWSAAAALLIAVPILLFAPELLRLFGPGFVVAAGALRIILIANLVRVLAGPVLFLMTHTGHERLAAVVLGVAATGHLALGLVLIPLFGLSGAAVATALAMVGWSTGLGALVRTRLSLAAGPFGTFG